MQYTRTLIVGSSASGLASAASLQMQGIDYIVIEKEGMAANPWRNHYERLHLHTNKAMSNLPYKKFDKSISNYPARQQVVDYLDDYQKTFDIKPVFHTEAKSIKRVGNYWITETNNDTFKSSYVVVATGAFGKPRAIQFNGMESFPGKIIHSYGYKSGRDFKGQKVLVVGFGNSACEIAIDLYEQGAEPCMSVRSPVNVIPRDLFGIPVLSLSVVMSKLPARVADTINAPLLRLLYPDLTRLGLKKKPYGIFEQISKEGSVPLLDIGTIKHIREGHIKIHENIDHISGRTVHFNSGKTEEFDAIIAAIGYYRDYAQIIDVEECRFADLRNPVGRQKYFGKDGLYFCGFFVSPTGQLREISLDARQIAKDIAGKEAQVEAS
jgi:indole-3-pyruvate monooxygenase